MTENQNGNCNQVFNSYLEVNQKSSYVDFSNHKCINHESQEKLYTISSPRWQKIQKEVAETLNRTREDMAMKYVTGKRVKVVELEEGEHISVNIQNQYEIQLISGDYHASFLKKVVRPQSYLQVIL